MWKIFIPLLTVFGICTAIFINPPEFWIDAKPDFLGASCSAIVFVLVLLFWIVMIYSQKKTESDLALTAYINCDLPKYAKDELAEPNPGHETNSGYWRWRGTAKNSKFAHLIPRRAPSYKFL